MTNLLFANQCPAPQYRSTFLSISAAQALANAPVSSGYVAGDSTALLGKLNTNSTRQDLVGSYGGGAYFLANGLKITAGTGLTVSVSAGTAMIDGAVNLEMATTLAVPASAGPIWIWLEQNGSLVYTVNLTPPASACLIGNVTTSATAVTAVDTSGVLYGSGILQRKTADAGIPTDSPPAGLHFYTVTQGGSYYWNGSAYANIAGKNGTNGTNGAAATVTVGTTTTGAAGSSATVTNSGTASAAVLNFTIPTGAGGSGSGVSSVANADSTLTLGGTASTPTLALNLANANTWTGAQTFPSATVSGAFTAGTLNVSGSSFSIGGNAQGNIKYVQNGDSSYFGICDLHNGTYFGLVNNLGQAIPGVVGLGGWYGGLGILATPSAGTATPIFGVNSSDQLGGRNGLGGNMFGVTAAKVVTTFNNTLDDGAGNLSAAGSVNASAYKVGNTSGVTTTLADGTTVKSGIVTAGPTVMAAVVSLASSTQTFSAAGKNYLVTATFSGVGTFSDAFYESSLSASNASFTASPNEAGRTTGVMSWIVYVPTGQTSLSGISLTASLRGRGWTGSSTSGVAATWTVNQIA